MVKLTRTQKAHEAQIDKALRELQAAEDRPAAVAAWERMKALITTRDPVVVIAMEQARMERVKG